MASTELIFDNWFDDYLTESLHATRDEIDYVKRLHGLRSKQRFSETKPQGPRFPSMIIDNFLYHGDFGHARNMPLLKELDIRHIINVSDLSAKKEIVDNFNVLWINLNDMADVDIRQHFDQTNAFLHACRNKDEKVLVHCQMGISRSSSVVLAYLLKYHHDTLHTAYDHLVERRRIAQPNDGFFLQLIRYEKDLRESTTSGTKQDHIKPLNTETVPPTIEST